MRTYHIDCEYISVQLISVTERAIYKLDYSITTASTGF